jgi:Glutaminase
MATTRETAILTVAAIRRRPRRPTEYLFNERQRIFTLANRVAADASAPRLLKSALDKERPLAYSLDLRRGLIQRITEPSDRHAEEFIRARIPEEKPSKPVRIDVDKIDPTTFNFVDLRQKWPPFLLCTNIIPTYAKALEIFQFCAQLSCNMPGPYAVTPCIPFQYVIDGCYARAHQMRRIITTRYRYCCEKVFSFANQNNDTLAVRANKWGGCCVRWWYHVAPLVRVRFQIPAIPKLNLTLAMVIDPGMFDKPVLLSTWLSAQQDSVCSANAHVSMYSIQPGTAYAPMNYAGTMFNTDPTYGATEATLIQYRSLTTC